MDTTNISTASVLAVNSNEIFHYQPKRKINVVNDYNELSLYDKNFTYIITFHPISPYTFDSSIGENFLQANDTISPQGFVDHDSYYLNLDAFDLLKDSTTSFYPILSLDGTCNYDGTSLEECELYNCFTVFIYKGELHWVVNDATSQPAKVHCKIDISNIEKQQNKLYHLILTRNDNTLIMTLILDNYSIFSIYEPEISKSIPQNRCFIDSQTDLNIIPAETLDATILFDTEYNAQMKFETNMKLLFTIESPMIIYFERVFDEKHKMLGCNISPHLGNGESPIAGSYISSVATGSYNCNIYNSSNVVVSGSYKTDRISSYTLQTGSYYIKLSISTSYYDYSKVAFLANNSLGNISANEKYILPSMVSFKLHTVYPDPYNLNLSINTQTSYVNLFENLNVSDCVGTDATVCIGYLERLPNNINIDHLLFKNSFKGYITEFSFTRDNAYFRKFNTHFSYNASEYITSYNHPTITTNRFPAYEKYQDGSSHFPEPYNDSDTESYQKMVLVNENNIPCKTITNMKWTGGETSILTCNNDVTDEDYIPAPRLQYITNFNIKDIILIDKDLIYPNMVPSDIDSTSLDNKITQIELPITPSDNTDIVYYGNDLTTSNTPTFCIFTFDIMKDLNNLDKVEIYDQVKYLMKSDYTLELYDENISYQEYLNRDTTNGYVRHSDFTRYSITKNNIIAGLNNYIKNIYNDTTKLYIVKFVIQCFRDSRYMFLYNISENLIDWDQFNVMNYDLDCRYYISNQSIDIMFNNLSDPYYTNYKYIFGHNNNFHKVLNYDFMSDYTTSDYIYSGYYFTKKLDYSPKTLQLGYSLNMYESDLSVYSLKNIVKSFIPTVLATDYDTIHLTNLDFDTVQIIDHNNVVYREVDFNYFKNNEGVFDKFFEYKILNDSTIQTQFIYDLNMLYYINLHTNKNNETYIIKDFALTEGCTLSMKPKYNIIKIDSTSYMVEYDNSTVEDNHQLIVNLQFDPLNQDSIKDLQLAMANNLIYNTFTYNTVAIYPMIKSDKPSIFETEWNNKYSSNLIIKSDSSIPKLQTSLTTMGHTYEKLVYNVTKHLNYASNTTSIYSSNNFQYWSTYSEYKQNLLSWLLVKADVTYDGDKRTVTPIIEV